MTPSDPATTAPAGPRPPPPPPPHHTPPPPNTAEGVRGDAEGVARVDAAGSG
jgi:hypothetical protein